MPTPKKKPKVIQAPALPVLPEKTREDLVPDFVRDEVLPLKHHNIQRAREEINSFLEYVFYDENTHQPILQAPLHETWQLLFARHKYLSIWSAMETGKCEVKDAPVRRPDGSYTPIQDLTEGDEILLYDPLAQAYRTSRLKQAWYNGKVPVVRITLASGHTHTITHEHPVFTKSGWTPARLVTQDHHLATTAHEPAGTRPYPDASLVALLHACAAPATTGVVYLKPPQKLRTPTLQYLSQRGGGLLSGDLIEWKISPQDDLYGEIRQWATSGCPRVPKGLWQADSDSLRAYLTTLLAAITPHITSHVRIPSPHRPLLHDLSLLLLRLGIHSQLRTDPHVSYLTIDESPSLEKLLPFLSTSQEILVRSLLPIREPLPDRVPDLWNTTHRSKFSDKARQELGNIPAPPARVTTWLQTHRHPLLSALVDPGIHWETVTSVEYLPPHDTWAIEIEDPAQCYLSGNIITHNTSQLTGYLLWRICHDPNIRIVVACKNEDQAQKIISTIQRYIETSKELREVFPHIRPGQLKQDLWNANAATVERSNTVIRDPTIQAYGLSGNPTGSRSNIVVLDDILTVESVATPKLRDDTWTVVKNKFLSRMTVTSQAIVIGTPYHPEDVLHRIEEEAKQKGVWYCYKFPVIDPVTWDEATITWPDRWTLEALREKQEMLNDPSEFARQMLCQARSEEGAQFKESDIEACQEMGQYFEPVYELSLEDLPPGCRIFTGVDLGIQKGPKHDWTVFFTILVYPDGMRQILWVESGRWSGPDIIPIVEDHYRRYNPILGIENNQGQDYILQFARNSTAANVIPFTTGRNKLHPEHGVEGLAIEIRNRKWIIPSVGPRGDTGYPEIDKVKKQMLFYKRGDHVGDHLMAMWIAKELARKFSVSDAGGMSVRVLGANRPPLKGLPYSE